VFPEGRDFPEFSRTEGGNEDLPMSVTKTARWSSQRVSRFPGHRAVSPLPTRRGFPAPDRAVLRECGSANSAQASAGREGLTTPEGRSRQILWVSVAIPLTTPGQGSPLPRAAGGDPPGPPSLGTLAAGITALSPAEHGLARHYRGGPRHRPGYRPGTLRARQASPGATLKPGPLNSGLCRRRNHAYPVLPPWWHP